MISGIAGSYGSLAINFSGIYRVFFKDTELAILVNKVLFSASLIDTP
jgi:hypothetical protein